MRARWWFGGWLAIVLFALAGPAVAEGDDKVDRLLHLSGLDAQVTGVPALFAAGVQRTQGMAQADQQVLLHLVEENIRPDVLYYGIRQGVSAALSPDQVSTLLAWYQSDLGQKITALEQQAMAPQAQADMLDQTEALLANTALLARAGRFDALLDAAAFNVSLQAMAMKTGVIAARRASQPQQPVAAAALSEWLAELRPRMQASAEHMTRLSFVYTYQSLPLAALDSYLDFLSIPASQAYNASVRDALQQGMAEGLASWQQEVGRYFSRQQGAAAQ